VLFTSVKNVVVALDTNGGDIDITGRRMILKYIGIG
jgi:hypothetical protein